MYFKTIFIAWLMFSATASQAGSFTAEIDRSTGVVGEEFTLELRLQGKLEESLNLPKVSGLKIESRGRSRSDTSINGVQTRELIFTFAIVPIRPGEFVFPSLKAKVDGEVVATVPLNLRITSQPQINSKNSLKRGPADFFVEREVSNSSPVVGEPFIQTTKFYVKSGIRSVQLERVTPVDDNLRYIKEDKTRGVEVRVGEDVYTMHTTRVVTVALSTDVQELSVSQWRAEYLVPNGAQRRSRWYDPFGSNQYKKARMTISGEAVPLRATAVPRVGRPKGFTGVVGKFTISAGLNQRTVKKGETVTLTISVRGKGLLEQLMPPVIKFPGKIKVYADKPELKEDVRFDLGVLSLRTFKYALVPSIVGKINLGAVRVPVFDSETKKFVHLTASMGSIVVEESENERSVIVSSNPSGVPGISKDGIKELAQDLIDIHRHFDAKDSQVLVNDDYLALSLIAGLPFTLLLLGFGAQSYRSRIGNDVNRVRRSRAYRNFKAVFAEKDGKLSVSDACLAYRLLLGDKLGIQGAAMTKQDVVERLKQKKVTDSLIEDAIKISDAVQKIEYSGGSVSESQASELIEKIRMIASEVDKQC